MALFNTEINCTNCDKKIPSNSKFCPHCGEPAPKPKSTIACYNCKEKIPVSSNFCPYCSVEIDTKKEARTQSKKTMSPEVWNRQSQDVFAQRISLSKSSQILTNGLIVEPGTKAIILIDGAIQEEIEAGRYSLVQGPIERLKSYLGSLGGQIKPEINALLVDTEDNFLRYNPESSYKSKDTIDLNVDLSLSLIISNPVNFLIRVLKGKDIFKNDDLLNFIKDILNDSISSNIRRYNFEEITINQEIQSKIRNSIIEDLRKRLDRFGLFSLDVSSFMLSNDSLAKVIELKGENVLKKAQNQERIVDKSLDKSYERGVEELELNHLQSRQEVYERLLQAKNLEIFTDLKSQNDRDKFKDKIDRDNLLRGSEWDSLVREVQAKADEEDAIIEHTRAVIEKRRGFELDQLDRTNRKKTVQDDIETSRIEDEYSRETLVDDTKTEENVKNIQSENELSRKKSENEFLTEQELKQIEIERKRDININRTSEERLKAALDAKERMNEMKLKRENSARKHEFNLQKDNNEIRKSEIEANKEIEITRAKSKEEISNELLKQQKEFSSKLEDYHMQSHETSKDTLHEFKDFAKSAFDSLNKNSKEKEDLIKERVEQAEDFKKDTVDKVTDVAGVRAGERLMKCPSCKQDVLATYRICNHCGHKFYE